MTTSKKNTRERFLYALIFFLGLTVLSCRKDSGILKQSDYDQFFETKTTNVTIRDIVKDLKRYNSQEEFAGKISDKLGFPLWEKTEMTKSGSSFTSITPIVNADEKVVTALLVATYKDNHITVLVADERTTRKLKKSSNSNMDKNVLGYYLYHFNQTIYNRGPQPTDIVFADGKLKTYMKHLLEQNKKMGWIPVYWVEEKDWYQYDYYEHVWYYTNTNVRYGIDWIWVPDNDFSPPPAPQVVTTLPSNANAYGSIGEAFESSGAGVGPHPRPYFEHPDKCSGFKNAWDNFPSNEVHGFITADGKVITVAIGGYEQASAPVTYTWQGTQYYVYNKSEEAPSQSYEGMLQNSTRYFIPVVASFHTHTPCRTDHTTGVGHSVGTEDKNYANSNPNMKHYVIGCDAIAEYSGSSNNFTNKKNGPLSSTCATL